MQRPLVMLELLALSAYVGVVACLISESNIAAPVRKFFNNCTLVNCPICLGFWLAVPTLLWNWRLYFLVVAMSNAWMFLILKVYAELDKANE